jgi:CheY-like chemotaxis protein
MGKTVLIADDDANFRQYLRTMLERSGYRVVEAEDGIKAMLRIMEGSPDLVLLDLDMPTISGHRVTELLNSVPEIRNIPFIVVSGMAEKAKSRLKMLGATAVFPKPFDQKEFLETIDALLASPTLEIIEEKPDGSPAPVKEPAAETDGQPVFAERQDWFAPLRGGAAQETIDLLRTRLRQYPEDLEVNGFLKLAESLVVRDFCNRFENPGTVLPRLSPAVADEITGLSLSPAEGFLLSQMDGQTDLGSLFHVSGMNHFRTCLLLEKLVTDGIVLLELREAGNA